MSQVDIQYYNSPVGTLKLGLYCDKLCLCDWESREFRGRLDNRIKQLLEVSFVEQSNSCFDKVYQQLDEYFNGQREVFTFPYISVGTAFQKHVWETIQTIHYGETKSYGKIAKKIGQPNAVRAVANATGANPLSLFIPCHRVIGSNGKLIGYAGGLSAKKILLELESRSV